MLLRAPESAGPTVSLGGVEYVIDPAERTVHVPAEAGRELEAHGFEVVDDLADLDPARLDPGDDDAVMVALEAELRTRGFGEDNAPSFEQVCEVANAIGVWPRALEAERTRRALAAAPAAQPPADLAPSPEGGDAPTGDAPADADVSKADADAAKADAAKAAKTAAGKGGAKARG